MAYTQDNRLIAIDTPLGKDVLLLHSFAGVESMSRLFSFNLSLMSENANIAFKALIGQRVTMSVVKPGNSFRYINGFVSRFAQAGADSRLAYYKAVVVPWLWFLTRHANCRIFQNMSIPDIIAKVFNDRGFGSDFSNKLQGTYKPREYCVQYRETDFNFVSRLMEQSGIFYYFEHDDKKHTLVLADAPSVHQNCPSQSTFSLQSTSAQAGFRENDDDVVTAWQLDQEMRPGKYALTDFNFKTPSTSLLSNTDSVIEVGGNSKYEIFDYPGIYENKPDGDDVSKTRMEEEEASYAIASGDGTCRAFLPGYRFTLTDHYRPDMNAAYVLTEVQHSASVGDSYTSDDSSGVRYSNHFTCVPATAKFRPARITPHPLVQGPQTAIVVGPAGEEIYVDKYGRVKVQFHWDREGKRDEKSSCWIRVSNPWAGKTWGAISNPRIGQEVIVDFLEGDPDRPIITGRVYNAEQMPPYMLPDNQTQSGIKTRSSQGGGASNFNELRFEDKMGQEEFYAHAEKDLTTEVEHDEKRTVQNDRTSTIQHNDTLTVLNTRSATIGTSDSLTAGTEVSQTAGTSFSITSGATMSVDAGASVEIFAGADVTIAAAGTLTITAPMVSIEAAMVQIAGVMEATSVIAPTYSPGVGNLI